jgi:hypothetical protein
MRKILGFILELPFKAFYSIVDFIVWELLSSGRWKLASLQRKNPDHFYQSQVEALNTQLRDQELDHQREIERLEKKHRQELDAERQKNRRHNR